MTPSAATSATHTPVLHRAVALLMTASLLAGTLMTMLVAPVSATQPPPANCGVRPIDLVLIIDRSGSMNTSEGAHTRLGWAKQAAIGLVNDLDANGGVAGAGIHRIGVSSFGGTTASRNVALSAASDAAAIAVAINGISATGGTPFKTGMAEGAGNMTGGARAMHGGVAVTQVTIFLSDGNPDPDSYTPTAGETTSYLSATDTAYAVAIGADGGDLGGGGTGVSYALMRTIAKPGYLNAGSPGAFRAVTSASGLPALFDEIYEEIACPTGTLEVVKNLVPSNDPGRFDLWIGPELKADEAGHNGTTGATNLIAGIYAVAETADGETSLANYTNGIACVDTASQNAPVAVTAGQSGWSVPVAGNSAVKCTITNTRNTGTLTVTKVVTNDNGGTAACGAFGFKVNGGSTIPFEADCTNVLTLPTGSYSVVEPAAAGYATSYAGCNQVAVTHEANATCTITNNDQPGTLIVNKVLSTDDGSDATCDAFGFKVNNGSAIGFEADCSNSMTVNAGTYSVVETSAAGFVTSYQNCSGLSVPNGGSATCTITNDDQPGTLIVVKEIEGGSLTCDDFSFAVNGGTAVAFDDDCRNEVTVDAGSYSVVESSASGYDTEYANCSNVAIGNGGSATCTITNTRHTGNLTVVKQLEPNADPGRFNLRVDGVVKASNVGDGGSTGSLNLETGSYEVSETAGTGTSVANYASSIDCRANGGQGAVIASGPGRGPLAVNVTEGAHVLCTVSNTRVTVAIDKTSDHGDNATVQPGDTIAFALKVTVNSGSATNVVVTDELPDGLSYVSGSADPASGFSVAGKDLTWNAGTLSTGSHTFEYEAKVDEDATGKLKNLGCVDADQNDDVVCDQTTSRVQRISVDKTNGSPVAVVPGSVVGFTLTLDVANGPVSEITIVDQLPEGLGGAADISNGGTYDATTNQITWNLADVEDEATLTYTAVVNATATAGEYTNVATITDGPCVGGGCVDDSTVVVRVPTLTVDKSADTDLITISGQNGAPIATPSVVTWTISWTLTDGPVTNVVISDDLPDGLVFIDASDGGTFADGTVSWNFATLSSSGSVTFRTTVDPASISRAGPTVNVAVIDSDETEPDEGQDSIGVSVEPPPLGGNPTPTPKPQLPDTAMADAQGGGVVVIPLALILGLLVGSLGAFSIASLRAGSRGRRG